MRPRSRQCAPAPDGTSRSVRPISQLPEYADRKTLRGVPHPRYCTLLRYRKSVDRYISISINQYIDGLQRRTNILTRMRRDVRWRCLGGNTPRMLFLCLVQPQYRYITNQILYVHDLTSAAHAKPALRSVGRQLGLVAKT